MPVPLIHFENVTVQREARVVLHDVNLSIGQGEHVAILGPNGSGKSTLIKVISRELYPLLKPEPWSLRILGRDRWHLFDLRNHLGIVSNDWIEMCTRDYSGFEIVLSGFFGSVGIWRSLGSWRRTESALSWSRTTCQISSPRSKEWC